METSPHTRGKPRQGRFDFYWPGNIPAYAGKAVSPVSSKSRPRKHPRIRGESVRASFNNSPQEETSPHTRGKQKEIFPGSEGVGNIPAYAGKANLAAYGVVSDRKHPRIRGESTPMHVRVSNALETSPHTRGKLKKNQQRQTERGNIPAYAGKAQISKHQNVLS